VLVQPTTSLRHNPRSRQAAMRNWCAQRLQSICATYDPVQALLLIRKYRSIPSCNRWPAGVWCDAGMVFADSRIGGGCSPLKGLIRILARTNDSLIARGVRCVAMEPFEVSCEVKCMDEGGNRDVQNAERAAPPLGVDTWHSAILDIVRPEKSHDLGRSALNLPTQHTSRRRRARHGVNPSHTCGRRNHQSVEPTSPTFTRGKRNMVRSRPRRHADLLQGLGVAANPWCSAMAGRSARMRSKIRCSSWRPMDFDASPMIDAAMEDRVNRGADTITTPSRTISPRCPGVRSEEGDPCGSFHGRWRVARYIGRHVRRCGQGRVDRSGAAADAKNRCQSGRLATRSVRRNSLCGARDRSQFWKDLTMAFYGYNRPGAKISEGVRDPSGTNLINERERDWVPEGFRTPPNLAAWGRCTVEGHGEILPELRPDRSSTAERIPSTLRVQARRIRQQFLAISSGTAATTRPWPTPTYHAPNVTRGPCHRPWNDPTMERLLLDLTPWVSVGD